MKKFKAVLFDLDGTLLPMDQDDFVKAYFGAITKKIAPLGYSPEKLIKGLWKGTAAMSKNDGSLTNEQLFWKVFAGELGEKILEETPRFDEFYLNEFDSVKAICGFNAKAAQAVNALHTKGYKLVLASNPFFPMTAQKKRMIWAGVDPNKFVHITSYENSHYCKPDPRYYAEISDVIGIAPDECLMVGNDAEEDVSALDAGMSVFLLTDCIINKKEREVGGIPQGGFDEFIEFVG